MKRCPTCSMSFWDHDRFCDRDGTMLATSAVCHNCNTTVSSSQKFCRQCGVELDVVVKP